MVFFGKSNNENTKNSSVLGFDLAEGIDQSLPFSDERAKLVSGHIHAIK